MTNILTALELVQRRLPRRAVSSIGASLALLLLPKCPLCIAAYLVSLGVGVEAAASAAPLVRPLAWLMVVAALGSLGVAFWRARRRRTVAAGVSCCCLPDQR